jgi:hypothetical protein
MTLRPCVAASGRSIFFCSYSTPGHPSSGCERCLAFLGEVINAAIMIAIVILGAGVNFFQTYRSQRAVERLRAQVAATATSLAPSAQFTIS